MIQIEIKKVVIVTILLYLFLAILSNVQANELLLKESESIGINKYMEDVQQYVSSEFDVNIKDIFSELVKGNKLQFKNKVVNKVIGLFGDELKDNILLISKYMSSLKLFLIILSYDERVESLILLALVCNQ